MTLLLDSWKFVRYEVTKNTSWYFVWIKDASGRDTYVEFTKGTESDEVGRLIDEMLNKFKLEDLPEEKCLEKNLGLSRRVENGSIMAAALSSVRSAISQFRSMERSLPLCEYLSGKTPASIDLYANINRGLFATDRLPNDFAKAAYKAVSRGFKVIKCAPFDEVTLPNPQNINGVIKGGLDRIVAIRESVGADVEILIDCHGRFEESSAKIAASLIHPIKIGWFEEPLDPITYPEGLARISNEITIPLAGGESGYGEEFFDSLAQLGSVQTIMPDIKYCGGVQEAVRIANNAHDNGINFSPHCPSGPISLLASAHVCASLNKKVLLEHAIEEINYRHELISPHEIVRNGRIEMPTGIGLGAALSKTAFKKYGEYFSF